MDNCSLAYDDDDDDDDVNLLHTDVKAKNRSILFHINKDVGPQMNIQKKQSVCLCHVTKMQDTIITQAYPINVSNIPQNESKLVRNKLQLAYEKCKMNTKFYSDSL